MAKIGSLVLVGKSKEHYTFQIYPLDQKFKALGAVYAITQQYRNDKGTHTHHVIYVGVTGDLSVRFESHHKEECFIRHKANCICVYLEGDEDSRLSIEDDLIKYYDPDCNG